MKLHMQMIYDIEKNIGRHTGEGKKEDNAGNYEKRRKGKE